MATASKLREQFRSIPKGLRGANQSFSIRVWRALSWLERAESMASTDHEGRFISCWIGLNALYGRLDKSKRPWGDREAWGTFISAIWRVDRDGVVPRLLTRKQLQVFKLIESKYLTSEFWEKGEPAARRVKNELKQAMIRVATFKVLKILLERLYIMRVQVFHGASTKGGKLNRRTLQGSAGMMMVLLPEMIAIMIAHGVEEDWGSVCFPPSQ